MIERLLHESVEGEWTFAPNLVANLQDQLRG
jgi:hypothetical protein